MTPDMIKGLMDACVQNNITNITTLDSGFDGMYVMSNVYFSENIIVDKDTSPKVLIMSGSAEFVYINGDWQIQ